VYNIFYLEVLSREGWEESREFVSWELGLVESVFNGGVSTFLKDNVKNWLREIFKNVRSLRRTCTIHRGRRATGKWRFRRTGHRGRKSWAGSRKEGRAPGSCRAEGTSRECRTGSFVLKRIRKRWREIFTEWWKGFDVVEGDGSVVDLLVNLLDVVGNSDFIFSGLGLEGSLLAIVGGDWDLGGFELCLRNFLIWWLSGLIRYLEVSDESLVLDSSVVVVPVDGSVEGGGLDVVSGKDVGLE